MNIAAIFAGGIGSRVTSATLPKQFLQIHGVPLIVHTLNHFQYHPQVDGIAVSILAEWRSHFEEQVARYNLTKVRWIVDGGATGQESRHAALRAIATDCPPDSVVLLHDGVRPLIDDDLISENIRTVVEHGPAVTTTKVTETIIESRGEVIDEVMPREFLHMAQAPQSCLLETAVEVYDRAVADGETDSIDTASLLQRYGHTIYRVEGPRSNIKITTVEDFYICRALFDVIEHNQIGG